MKNIREGVFETNSSSMHSIAVMRDADRYSGTVTPEEAAEGMYAWDGKWSISEDDLEFGRHPFQILCTLADKARYAIASLVDRTPEGQANLAKITAAVVGSGAVKEVSLPTDDVPVYVRADGTEIPTDRYWYVDTSPDGGYVYDHDGERCPVEFKGYRVVEVYGGIDHQSAGLLPAFLKSHPDVTLEDFLLKRRYIVIVDGDEYHDFDKYARHGFFPVDLMEERCD